MVAVEGAATQETAADQQRSNGQSGVTGIGSRAGSYRSQRQLGGCEGNHSGTLFSSTAAIGQPARSASRTSDEVPCNAFVACRADAPCGVRCSPWTGCTCNRCRRGFRKCTAASTAAGGKRGYVTLHSNRYSVALDWIGRRMEVRDSKDEIEIQLNARRLVTLRRIAEAEHHSERLAFADRSRR